MTKTWLPFIDWMKFIGMLVIVFGHTGGHAVITSLTDPFNPKQLGVVFFVFVMGFGLARESRSRVQVVYNRLFEIYLFGLLFAVALSLLGAARIAAGVPGEGLRLSNYLPLLLGGNVVLNHFPANPTTWYIGTYLHLVLLWALVLRRVRVRWWMLALSLMLEIPLRALLMWSLGDFVAYQLLTNWVTAFLLGQYVGQRFSHDAARPGTAALAGYVTALAVGILVWRGLTQQFAFQEQNPFGVFSIGSEAARLLTTSSCVSLLYFVHTILIFQIARRLPDLAFIRFCARNTLVVFIAHMPLIAALTPLYYPHLPQGWLRLVVNLGLFYFVLSAASEVVRKAIRPRGLRDSLWLQLAPHLRRPAPNPTA